MMLEQKLGFVVLHYCAVDMTIECVDEIRKHMTGQNYAIIVVDNGSGNGTGDKLADRYSGDNDVTVLINQENLGFAKGNNIGYLYGKKTLHCDFLCVMNNDVMILQDNFFDLIKEQYEQDHFAVSGPHVTLPGNKENAMYYKMASLEELKKEWAYYQTRYAHLSSNVYQMWNGIDGAKTKLRIALGKMHVMPELVLHEEMTEGCHDYHTEIILHGCCVIFSPRYLELFDDAFVPDTFLFREEELLYLRCKEHDFPMIYNPKLDILHMEDVSTNMVYRTERKKELFHLKNQIDSMGILIRKLEEMQID